MKLSIREQEHDIINMVRKQTFYKRLFEFVLGCFIVAVAYNIFIAPNHLVPKGVGGIAVIVNSLFGISNAITIFALNGVLLIASLFFLGKEKTKASLFGSILYPLFVYLTENINVWLQVDTSHILLSAICGGILYGLGIGFIFRAGFTTGGTDIVNQIVSKYGKVSIGKSMLFIDGCIVLCSGIFLGINTMLYSILGLYITSMISDRVILGISDSKAFLIITNREKDVKAYIVKHLHHGVTSFQAQVGYHRENETVLLTVLPTKEYFRLKEGIKRIDKDAFYIITDTYEVFGGEYSEN